MMKKLTLILGIAVLLSACKQSPKNASQEASTTIPETSEKTPPTFQMDSVVVQDSVKVNPQLTVAFSKQALFFPSVTNKTILDSLYSPNQTKVLDYNKMGLQNALAGDMKKYFEQYKKNTQNYKVQFKQEWYENSSMKRVSHINDFLTLAYRADGFTGGAHGYFVENYKVFDLKENKVVHQEDIFKNPKDSKWQKILMAHFTNKDQKEMLLVDTIEMNNNFYFDDHTITFVYNQYEITAYAAGVVEIKIPFDAVKSDLKDSFLERLKP